jgi:hypothetical protein
MLKSISSIAMFILEYMKSCALGNCVNASETVAYPIFLKNNIKFYGHLLSAAPPVRSNILCFSHTVL